MSQDIRDFGDGIVAFTEDGGQVVKFFHVGTIEYEKEWYAFFQPATPLDGIDPDELIAYRIVGGGNSDELVPVKDDETLDGLFAAFMQELEDSEEIDQCSECGGCASRCQSLGCGGNCGKCNK